jgi:hypothetical protein
VKGIEHKLFALDILPNHPSILVAPNGFGKSSFATAFASLKPRSIKLDKGNFFENDETKLPVIRIKYQNEDNTVEELEANDHANTLSKKIACFVINSRIKPKITSVISGRASAKLTVERIVLMDNIPPKGTPEYRHCRDELKSLMMISRDLIALGKM